MKSTDIFNARITKLDNNEKIEIEYAELEYGTMFECVIDHDCDYKIEARDEQTMEYRTVGFYDSLRDEYRRS
jgi:hypothetical protein